MHDKDKSDQKTRRTYLEISSAMKRDLKTRDAEIRALLKS